MDSCRRWPSSSVSEEVVVKHSLHIININSAPGGSALHDGCLITLLSWKKDATGSVLTCAMSRLSHHFVSEVPDKLSHVSR
jgi:hypothetical protein